MEYTVFCDSSDGDTSVFMSNYRDNPEHQTLAGLIQYAVDYIGYSDIRHVPVAWCGSINWESEEAHRAQCIRAGRLIEKTPSGWVALGAEKQEGRTHDEDIEKLWAEACSAMPHTFIKRELRKGEPTSADLAMIARDGAAKPKTYAPFTPFGTFSDAPVSTAKPNPFPNTLRSPDCDSGPSDHLNASRHQMAGMSD